ICVTDLNLSLDIRTCLGMPHMQCFKRYGISPEQQAREWREWQFDPEPPLQTQAFEAWSKVCRWLRPDINNSHKLAELLLCETFVHALPENIRSEWSSRCTQQACGATPEPSRRAPEPSIHPSKGQSF
uniref:SCAN box domain-containing protein n=1 Tax=Erpetoichthys calabaricus TaxID=27687 RepID=A0A8C4T7Y8_ERPCA